MNPFQTLTASEKRTIRIAATGLGAALLLLGGLKLWRGYAQQRTAYLHMVAEAQELKREAQTYADKVEMVKKLMNDFQLDPARLDKKTVVASASAAIQKAAAGGGVQPGAIHELPGRSANKELGSIQFEGAGQVAAVMALLQRLPLLGYPLVIDAVQITPDTMRPGQMKLSLTIIVLDFEQWKKMEAAHA